MNLLSKKNPNNLSRKKIVCLGLLTSALFTLGACQSSPTEPVMQRADSTFETTGFGETKTKAQTMALANAEKTCGWRQPIILNDEVTYNGVLDERTGRMIDQVSSVAGAIFGTGKPNLSREDDYEFNITFRCK